MHQIPHYNLHIFERELALLVALQVESIWKGGGGTDIHTIVAISIQKSLQKVGIVMRCHRLRKLRRYDTLKLRLKAKVSGQE